MNARPRSEGLLPSASIIVMTRANDEPKQRSYPTRAAATACARSVPVRAPAWRGGHRRPRTNPTISAQMLAVRSNSDGHTQNHAVSSLFARSEWQPPTSQRRLLRLPFRRHHYPPGPCGRSHAQRVVWASRGGGSRAAGLRCARLTRNNDEPKQRSYPHTVRE